MLQHPTPKTSLAFWLLCAGSAAVLVALVCVGVIFALGYRSFSNQRMLARFDAAQQLMAQENWEGAARAFDGFLEEYPHSSLAGNARVHRAYCEIGAAKTPAEALEMTRKLIREYSNEGQAYSAMVPKIGEQLWRIAERLAEVARDEADPKALQKSLDARELLRSELSAAPLPGEAQAKLDQTIEAARVKIKKKND